MKRPHLLRVDRGPEAFATLLEALGEAGERAGWLELGTEVRGPDVLEAAAARGVLRAVAVTPAATVSVKPRRGPAALDALLREHFLGCRLVLVRGDAPAPTLTPEGDAWRLGTAAGKTLRWTTLELLRALGRPHPFGDP